MGSKMRLIVKINDDLEILDFLADLEDRTPIETLDMLLAEDKNKRYFILDRHNKEGITTVLLCNAPFDVNKNGNILMLLAHSELEVIQGYFRRWIKATDYKDEDKRIAIRQALNVIQYYILHKEELEKPQISKAEK